MSVHVPASQSAPPSRSIAKSSPSLAWGWTLAVLLAAGAAVTAANLTHDRLFHPKGHPAAEAGKGAAPAPPPAPANDQQPTHDLTTTVVLPEGKFKQAEIKVEPVQTVEMPKEVAVTGKIEADPNRRVDIRPRAPGVVRTVPALPGTKVKKGDTLVVLDSPDVGSARLKVRETPARAGHGQGRGGVEGRHRRQRPGHDRADPQGGRLAALAQAVRRQDARGASGDLDLGVRRPRDRRPRAGEADRAEPREDHGRALLVQGPARARGGAGQVRGGAGVGRVPGRAG